MYRNISDAFVGSVAHVHQDGEEVFARGQHQKEIVGSLIKMEQSQERFAIVPGRRNNVFAQIAETLWVLAGRDDLAYLSCYLPRAAEFSDDGKVWRAAYGPRIRSWKGKQDQVKKVINRFEEDPFTKRAVISIFDPELDYCDSKDIPCNNWLHFLRREDKLHLNVTVRANDLFWGFSGINYFEWSLLHQVIANTLECDVGTTSWFVGSLHVYERHYATSKKIVDLGKVDSIYEFGLQAAPCGVTMDSLDETLELGFKVHDYCQSKDLVKAKEVISRVQDPYFSDLFTMICAYWAIQEKLRATKVLDILGDVKSTDMQAAGLEYTCRRYKIGIEDCLTNFESEVQNYFSYYSKIGV